MLISTRESIGTYRCIHWYAALMMLLALLVCAAPGLAGDIVLDKDTQGQGNKGLSYRPADGMGGFATFVLTARSSVDETQPLVAGALGSPGTVVVDKDKGTGVQDSGAGGSEGISGGGGDKDEELIFTYDVPVFLYSIQLGLADIEFGSGVGEKDDPVIFLSLASSGVFGVTIQEAEILSAFTGTDKTGTVDFNSFTSLAGNSQIAAFKIRETNDHIFVNTISPGVEIPEPSLCSLMIAGAVLLVGRRRARARAGR